jgi:expansin (peptidoglycan-binding protein)
MCGKMATVSWQGKSVRVRVVDECPECGYDNLDLSPAAFEQLADKGVYISSNIVWRGSVANLLNL